MVGNITDLYPNIYKQDRRQQSTPVEFDYRSGLDRRSGSRPAIDPKLKDDIDQTKSIFAALSPVAPIRRIASIPDNIKDGNYTKAAGLLGLAYVNIPEDVRDLTNAGKQIFKGKLPAYDYKNYQTPFSFFRGTKLEPVINKLGKFGAKLHQWDIPLFDTKLGKIVQKKLNIRMVGQTTTGRKVPKLIFNEISKNTILKQAPVKAFELQGSAFAKIIGKSLLRIPLLSVFALGVFELPAIIKAFGQEKNDKSKLHNGITQITKSSINVSSLLAGIGTVGAVLAKYGSAYSMLGMGLGSILGSLLASKINKIVDCNK
ncbi:MAG: hypothetical protein A2287_06500 [Candidatus Melainabacteria bacterium RIFOXYA12_FULL_32_12]|nr:MAG: hypothetical protein A2255_04695 [Candidatus Melainabacteria bacterium RIFOXYA2_FULL_32_9]OGI26330.1 MAG: hypothetical protein A2287_06500 [Candidatus Melainabacteria bacterium RIFOXYA12_FULL_32_12]